MVRGGNKDQELIITETSQGVFKKIKRASDGRLLRLKKVDAKDNLINEGEL